MKQASTFVLLFVVLVFVVATFKVKENFQNPSLRIPNSPVEQRNLVQSSKEEDYAPSSTSMAGPAPGTIASFNSLPYRDPSSESANYQRLLNLQTTLKGFLTIEAPNLQDMSDPSIQLPLTSARSDLNRLENEILVLKRNPGIDSSITQGDLDEIQANLAWLQHKYRQSVYNEVEGFDDMSGMSFDSSGNAVADSSGNAVVDSSGNAVADSSGNAVIDKTLSERLTRKDLDDLLFKIDAKITNLSSSGTTDPVVLRKIEILNKIKQKVNDIKNSVDKGTMNEKDIPITKSSSQDFLKSIDESDSNNPISINSLLSYLFNSNTSNVSADKDKQELYDKYIDILFKGLSWNFNVSYTSENQFALANSYLNSLNNQNLPQSQGYFNDVVQGANTNIDFNKPVYNQQQNQIYSVNGTTSNIIMNNQPKDNYEKRFETQKSNKSSVFDWHERANYICEAIQKRGMNPKDFGCLDNNDFVSENFSWRGYAKMICTRLGTSYDTGLPETCGCPPANWPGWKP